MAETLDDAVIRLRGYVFSFYVPPISEAARKGKSDRFLTIDEPVGKTYNPSDGTYYYSVEPGKLGDWGAYGKVMEYIDLVRKWAQKNKVDENLILAVIHQESSGNPDAVGTSADKGLMQFTPGTGDRYGLKTDADFFDPNENIRAGSEYLRFLLNRFGNDAAKAIAGYNAGEGNVDDAQAANVSPPAKADAWYKNIDKDSNANPSVKNHVKHVMAFYKKYYETRSV